MQTYLDLIKAAYTKYLHYLKTNYFNPSELGKLLL
jgi:hypothetical protein|uniref:Uncharacterized protein n=1 Tax=uncultured Polaribacter sp. TaxID=174711 RepID=H6RHR8_9FLAO|nr:hypothetical protein VIS_S3DHC20009 [uncultured Polaribacter sp.]